MSTSHITDLLNLAYVQHWHTVPTLRKPSVAEHSFRVAVIAMELADTLFVHSINKYEVMRWALMHDGPESETGDLPRTAKIKLRAGVWADLEKRMCPWYDRAYPREASIRAVVKIADLMECWMFINQWGRCTESAVAVDVIDRELKSFVKLAAVEFNWPNLGTTVAQIIEHARRASDTRHAQSVFDYSKT